MKFGNFLFKSSKEFQEVLNLAIEKGLGTDKEFAKFLNENYSEYLVKGN